MQWLIDIVKEWIEAQGYLTAGFVDRGDPIPPDYTIATLTADSAWHDLDLSAIVPENAKAVLVALLIEATIVEAECGLRKKGNIRGQNIAMQCTQVANTMIYGDLPCPLSSDRKVQYYLTNTTWTTVFFTVKGWWF